MRFLAWRILGWIFKEAWMAAAACLFQKDGFSSSAGTVQTCISPSWPAPASLGHPCREPTSQGHSFPGHSHAGTSSHMNQVVQGGYLGWGETMQALHPLPGPRVLGQGTRDSKTRHDGELSGEWDGATSMLGMVIEDTGTSPRPAPSTEANKSLAKNWFKNPRRAGVTNPHQSLLSWAAPAPLPKPSLWPARLTPCFPGPTTASRVPIPIPVPTWDDGSAEPCPEAEGEGCQELHGEI